MAVLELDVNECVERGIALLDREFGTNFHKEIDLDRLNIGSGFSCVCGQLYGEYTEGIGKLGLDSKGAELHGFYLSDRLGLDPAYAELTEVWREQLLARSA